jgi:cell division protein ZapA
VTGVTQDVNVVDIHILGKEYRVACNPQEQQALVGAAHFLDSKMKEIRDRGKVIGAERIAIMAALNIAHELLELQTQGEEQARLVSRQIQALQDKIESALRGEQQAEDMV